MKDLKLEQLDKIRYHWHSYVARGGFSEPKMLPGNLEENGQFHWTLFLQLGKQYLNKYPKEKYILAHFVPDKMLRLLTGE